MQARIRKTLEERAKGEKGFTLIELLVVIVIIGLLAAIAIPSFLNQRQKAWVSQAQADVKNAAIAAEAYAVDNNGSYASMTATTLDSTYGYNATAANVVLTVPTADASGFTLKVTHGSLPADKDEYTYTSSTGKITVS
jgi:type IV pilus assembly protein PilA